MVVKIYIENTGRISGRDVPDALTKLDHLMREKFDDSVPQALARGTGHGNRYHVQHHRKARSGGDIDQTIRRLFSRRRRA